MLNSVARTVQKQYKPLIFSAIVASAVVTLNGCARVEGLYVDPTFTYAAMLNDNIGIGGVASSLRPLRPSIENAYANQLRNAVVNQYPGMNIQPAGMVAQSMGKGRYQRMLHNFGNYGVVQPQVLSELHNQMKHTRYLAFAKISQNSVSQNQDNMDPNNPVYRTTLTLSVQMVVYDLNQQKLVWTGTLTESKDNENTYNIPSAYVAPDQYGHVSKRRQIAQERIHERAAESVRNTATYPNAPDASNLLNQIFSGLAKKLPVPTKQ